MGLAFLSEKYIQSLIYLVAEATLNFCCIFAASVRGIPYSIEHFEEFFVCCWFRGCLFCFLWVGLFWVFFCEFLPALIY